MMFPVNMLIFLICRSLQVFFFLPLKFKISSAHYRRISLLSNFQTKLFYNACFSQSHRNHQERLWNIFFACGIFVDLQKAFDAAEHDMLLTKLEHYSVRGLANGRFKSYLSDRNKFVLINGHDSNPASVLYCATQGSVFGPLLFQKYINDLYQAIKFFKVHHFADNQTYFISVNL